MTARRFSPGLLVLCASLGAGCQGRSAPAEADAALAMKADATGVSLEPGAGQWKYLELAVAEVGPALPPLPMPGHVQLDPKRSAAVGAPMQGRLEQVTVRLGSRVRKGDRLFAVRSGAYADLDHEVASSRAELTVKQRLLERARELFALKAIPHKDVLAAEAELTQVELQLKGVQSRRSSLSVDPGGDNLFWVRASRAGTVVEVNVSPGEEVGPERSEPLLRLSDLDEVLTVADVPEAEVGQVRAGEAVDIRLPGGDAREGVVEYVSEVVEPQRRTVEVWVRARNADRSLRPNAFVEVLLRPGAEAKVVRVPDAAVVTQGTRSVVFVLAAPGRLEPRPVRPGRRRDGLTELREGLEPGTRYVARGALLLLNQVDLASGT